VDRVSHKNLFGTVVRLRPIFQPENNVEMVVIADADNMITNDYIKELETFRRSKDDVNTFCSRFEISLYKEEGVSDCFLRTGMISTKMRLDPHMWEFILHQVHVYSDPKFAAILKDKQDLWTKLVPHQKIKAYRDFEYGMDEIILNYYIRRMFELRKARMRKITYRPGVLSVFNMMGYFLRFSYKTNPKVVDEILGLYVKPLGPDVNKNIERMVDNVREQIGDSSYSQVMPVIMPLRKRIDLLEAIPMSQTVVDFFKKADKTDFDAKMLFEYMRTEDVPMFLRPPTVSMHKRPPGKK